MKKDSFFIVLLAGGRGERFWPKSRLETPKQILPLFSDKTLIEESVLRLKSLITKDNLYILCSKELKTAFSKLNALENAKIIAEPASRNTAGAIALVSALAEKKNPGAVLVVLPCDQYIADKKKFVRVLKTAVEMAAANDKIVTIGIKPAYPSTGYGYINVGDKLKICQEEVFAVNGFKEKPRKKTAEKYFRSGKFLWNAGIFVFKSSKMLELFKEYAPGIYNSIIKIVNSNAVEKSLNFIYPKIESISIDYAIMEKTKDILCVEGNFQWCDVGSWESLEYIFKKDDNGNIIKAGHFAGLDVRDSIILGEKDKLIAAIGIDGLIIVQTKDAVLVCPKHKAQQVKSLVEELKKSKKTEKFL